ADAAVARVARGQDDADGVDARGLLVGTVGLEDAWIGESFKFLEAILPAAPRIRKFEPRDDIDDRFKSLVTAAARLVQGVLHPGRAGLRRGGDHDIGRTRVEIREHAPVVRAAGGASFGIEPLFLAHCAYRFTPPDDSLTKTPDTGVALAGHDRNRV